MMQDYGMGWHWMGGIGMILFWLVVVLLVVALFKYVTSKPTTSTNSLGLATKTALDYLNEAYAKGEISRDEFLQKRADLKRD